MKYYKTLIILFFIFSFGKVNAQDGLDSLLTEYKTASLDRKIVLFHLFSEEILSLDKDTILFYVKDLQAEGIKNNREDAIAMSSIGIVPYLQFNSLFDEASQKIKNAINYYQKVGNDTLLSMSYNILGNNSFLEGKIVIAEGYYMKSSEYAKRSGEKRYEMLSVFNLAKIYTQQAKYEKAEKNIKAYIDFLKNEETSITMLAAAYGLLGQMFLDQGMHDEAIENFSRSMEFGLTSGSLKTVAHGYTNLAIAEYFSENYDRSEQYFQLALAYRVKDNNQFYIAEGYYNLGDFYVGRERLDSALINYQRSFEFAQLSNNFTTQKDALVQIEGVYETLNQHTKQIEVLKQIIDLQDKISKQQSLKGLSALRLSYDQDFNEAINIGGIREEELHGKIGTIESVFNNWIVLTIACLLGLSVFVFYVRKRNKN